MTLPPDTMMDLMAYADGELDEGGRARVERLLATNAEARGVAQALGVLGDEVRDAVLDRPMPRADGIADLVMAGLDGSGAAGASASTRAAPVGRTGAAGSFASSAPVAPVLPIG